MEQEVYNAIKDLVLSKIKESNKTIADISSYGIITQASGIFQITIFWRGKLVKGSKKSITMNLDANPETGFIALKVMMEILQEARSISFLDSYKKNNKSITKKKDTIEEIFG